MEEASSILDVLQLLAQWEHTWYSSYGEAQGLSEQKKIKDGGPCANEDANLPHIHWKFCLPCLQDTDHSIYTYNDSRLFSRSYGVLSNCTEEWNNQSTSCPLYFSLSSASCNESSHVLGNLFLGLRRNRRIADIHVEESLCSSNKNQFSQMWKRHKS